MSLSHSNADKASFVRPRRNAHVLRSHEDLMVIVMSSTAQRLMRNFERQFTAVSALRNPAAGLLDEPRKTLFALVGAISIAFVASLAPESLIRGTDPSAVGIDLASIHQYADVPEPGSRGSAVDI